MSKVYRTRQDVEYDKMLAEAFTNDGWLEMEMRRDLSYGDLHNPIETRDGDIAWVGRDANFQIDSTLDKSDL